MMLIMIPIMNYFNYKMSHFLNYNADYFTPTVPIIQSLSRNTFPTISTDNDLLLNTFSMKYLYFCLQAKLELLRLYILDYITLPWETQIWYKQICADRMKMRFWCSL